MDETLKEKIKGLKSQLVDSEMKLYDHQQKVCRPAIKKRNQLIKLLNDTKKFLYDALQQLK